MPHVELRLHGTLNDFLPARARDRPLQRPIAGSPSVKDVIEAAGVPHVEVQAIVADGRSVGFEHRVRNGELIEVYPAPHAHAASVEARVAGPAPGSAELRPEMCREPAAVPAEMRFVADGHLGRLAAYLRMLGFDTAYSNHAADAELAAIAAAEDRVLLSRDVGLLKRSIVRRGYFLRSDRPHEQLREVVQRFDLARASRPFGRCLRCNGRLEPIEPSSARERVPPRVAFEQDEFRRCPACDTVYWRGSHHARMVRLIEQVVPEALVASDA